MRNRKWRVVLSAALTAASITGGGAGRAAQGAPANRSAYVEPMALTAKQ